MFVASRPIVYSLSVSIYADIYVSCVSYSHNVAAKGFFVASVSTYVETSNPERELQPGLDLLGPVLEKYGLLFLSVTKAVVGFALLQVCVRERDEGAG